MNGERENDLTELTSLLVVTTTRDHTDVSTSNVLNTTNTSTCMSRPQTRDCANNKMDGQQLPNSELIKFELEHTFNIVKCVSLKSRSMSARSQT